MAHRRERPATPDLSQAIPSTPIGCTDQSVAIDVGERNSATKSSSITPLFIRSAIRGDAPFVVPKGMTVALTHAAPSPSCTGVNFVGASLRPSFKVTIELSAISETSPCCRVNALLPRPRPVAEVTGRCRGIRSRYRGTTADTEIPHRRIGPP
jgi:hypothetical protein